MGRALPALTGLLAIGATTLLATVAPAQSQRRNDAVFAPARVRADSESATPRASEVDVDRAASCRDGHRNGSESDVDCGGGCSPCYHGLRCGVAQDCWSGRCAGGYCEARPYGTNSPVPDGYRVVASDQDAAATVRLAGVILVGAGYGAGYLTAVAAPQSLGVLFIPVLGPAIALDGVDDLPFDDPDLARAFLIADLAVQAGGFSLLLLGMATAGQQLVRVESASSVQITPIVGADRVGVGVVGRF